jgi:hypothetical protein
VFCTDRDTIHYDLTGVITSAVKHGNQWTFRVAFDRPDGKANPPRELDDMQIWPDQEEQDKEEAKQRRADEELRIFLCHGSEDKEAVRQLHAKLKTSGMRPWLDEVNIESGTDWDESIRTAIKESHILLAILSKRSTAKAGYVQKEIRFALDRADEMPEGRVYIIPVLLEECEIPSRLSRWQAVRLYDPEGETKLFSALRKRAAQMAGDT